MIKSCCCCFCCCVIPNNLYMVLWPVKHHIITIYICIKLAQIQLQQFIVTKYSLSLSLYVSRIYITVESSLVSTQQTLLIFSLDDKKSKSHDHNFTLNLQKQVYKLYFTNYNIHHHPLYHKIFSIILLTTIHFCIIPFVIYF